jgi:hypothetical protein
MRDRLDLTFVAPADTGASTVCNDRHWAALRKGALPVFLLPRPS